MVHGFAVDTPADQRRWVVLVLGAAILGASSSAVLVKGMEAGPLAITAWRTLGAAVLLSPGVARELRGISWRDLGWTSVAGLVLAAHFWTYFAGLGCTTVLRASVLVCLVPLWTGLLEWGVDGRSPPARFWGGLLVAMPGVALLSGGPQGEASLLGDLLATLAGVLWAIYFFIGRRVRARVGVGAYMGLVCLAASLPLWPLGWWLGEALVGFPVQTWWLLLLAILGPQLLGHQGANYAVKWLPASLVAAVMLLEPVGATFLAAVFLGEVPPLLSLLGGLIVVAGVVRATLAR